MMQWMLGMAMGLTIGGSMGAYLGWANGRTIGRADCNRAWREMLREHSALMVPRMVDLQPEPVREEVAVES